MMSTLAEFLAAETGAIVELYTQRFQTTLVSAGHTRSELFDHLPTVLAEVAQGTPTTVAQRLRTGFELVTLVREYGLLRDCIDERLEIAGLQPTTHDVRLLDAYLSLSLSASVDRYVMERGNVVDEALRFSEERYHSLFDSIDDGFCVMQMIFDAQGKPVDYRFLETNAAFEVQTGLANAVGKTARELVPTLDESWFRLYGSVADTGVTQRFENRAPALGRWFDVYAQRVGAPGRRQVALVFKDITQRKLADQAREEAFVREQAARAEAELARQRQHDLFMQAPVAIAILEGPEHRYSFANPAYRALVNHREVFGKTLYDALPDVRELGFDKLLDQVMATGEAHVAKEMPIKLEHHVGDEILVVTFVYSAKRDANGAIDGVLVSAWDVTALVQARQHAEQASRLKDEFLATVSHELRTPLTSMLGWTQMLRTGNLPEAQQTKALETIERNARAQAQLIEDLLDMSRILAGQLRLEVGPIDVAPVVAAAIETVRPSADAKQIRLQSALPSGALVIGDAERLQQVIWNLLTNAVKFTPKGGRVEVSVACQDSSVDITIADTGQGIPPDFLPYVFDRFRQAEGGMTRRHGGLGLGLSIVRQLVELHGGVVSAVSAGDGQGSTFVVRLPLSVTRRRSSEKTVAVAPTEATGALAGLTLLVIDDEEDTRELLQMLLETHGAQVRIAGSAEEARKLLVGAPSDVIISDIGMPDETGYSLIESIRKLPPEQGGEVPAVALTAYARSEDRTRALLAGFNNHVAKPVEPDELVAVVLSLARTRTPRA